MLEIYVVICPYGRRSMISKAITEAGMYIEGEGDLDGCSKYAFEISAVLPTMERVRDKIREVSDYDHYLEVMTLDEYEKTLPEEELDV